MQHTPVISMGLTQAHPTNVCPYLFTCSSLTDPMSVEVELSSEACFTASPTLPPSFLLSWELVEGMLRVIM